ncbi:hypothetical protein D3C75_1130330 [compost metagenome]
MIGDEHHFRAFLLDLAGEHGELSLGLGIEQRLLHGLPVLGFGRRQRLAGDLQARLDQCLVKTEQRLTLVDLLVGLDMEGVDHALQGRADHRRMRRNQLAGGEHAQAHGQHSDKHAR